MLLSTVNQGQQHKRSIDNVLLHSVSCEFPTDAYGGGLRRKKKQRRDDDDDTNAANDESGDDDIMTEAGAPVDAALVAAAALPSSVSKKKKKEEPTSPPSVVPLSMQLFRPFWALSCCPDCDTNPMGNHHRNYDSSFLMDGGGLSGSPPSIDGVGALDARLRSVSMTSLKGVGISSSSASSTITGVGGRRSSGRMGSFSSNQDHFKTEEEDERKNAAAAPHEEEDVNEDELVDAVASANASSFLPSSSSSLESTNKQSSSSPSSSSPSGVLLDTMPHHRMSNGRLRNDRLLITPDLNTTTASNATNPNTSLANTITIEQLLHEYTTACTIYGCHNRINPGVLTTLRYQLPTLRVSGNFFDADMLALSEIMLRHCNGALKYINRLDFSIAAKEGKSSSFGGGSGNGKRGTCLGELFRCRHVGLI